MNETETNSEASESADSTDEGSSGEAQAQRQAIETRAVEMGWSPKDQWRGDPTKWMDADVFVERGEQLLPFVRAENRRLRERMEGQGQELNSLRSQIKELTDFNSEMTTERLKTKRVELTGKIKEARESGDVEAEMELADELAEVNTKIREPKTKSTNPSPSESDPTQNPEFKEWTTANEWFGSDQRRTDYAMAVAQRLRVEKGLSGRALLTAVGAEVAEVFGTNSRRREPSRVDSSSGTPPRNSEGNGRAYSDLPADARAVCDRQVAKFVGKGKAFATQKEWQTHFCKQYFG